MIPNRDATSWLVQRRKDQAHFFIYSFTDAFKKVTMNLKHCSEYQYTGNILIMLCVSDYVRTDIVTHGL